MKVLLLPSYFLPEGISSPYISWNRNQAFVEEGWDVVVYTPVPCRGISDDVRKEYKHKKLEMMLDGKMTVHRFSLIPEKKNPLLRASDILSRILNSLIEVCSLRMQEVAM